MALLCTHDSDRVGMGFFLGGWWLVAPVASMTAVLVVTLSHQY